MPAREQVPRRRRAAPAPRPHGTDSASTAPPAPPLGARRASGANNLHLCIQKLQAQRPGTRWHGSCFGGGVLSVASHRLVAAATLAASTACVAACGRDQPLTFAPAAPTTRTPPLSAASPLTLTVPTLSAAPRPVAHSSMLVFTLCTFTSASTNTVPSTRSTPLTLKLAIRAMLETLTSPAVSAPRHLGHVTTPRPFAKIGSVCRARVATTCTD